MCTPFRNVLTIKKHFADKYGVHVRSYNRSIVQPKRLLFTIFSSNTPKGVSLSSAEFWSFAHHIGIDNSFTTEAIANRRSTPLGVTRYMTAVHLSPGYTKRLRLPLLENGAFLKVQKKQLLKDKGQIWFGPTESTADLQLTADEVEGLHEIIRSFAAALEDVEKVHAVGASHSAVAEVLHILWANKHAPTTLEADNVFGEPLRTMLRDMGSLLEMELVYCKNLAAALINHFEVIDFDTPGQDKSVPMWTNDRSLKSLENLIDWLDME